MKHDHAHRRAVTDNRNFAKTGEGHRNVRASVARAIVATEDQLRELTQSDKPVRAKIDHVNLTFAPEPKGKVREEQQALHWLTREPVQPERRPERISIRALMANRHGVCG